MKNQILNCLLLLTVISNLAAKEYKDFVILIASYNNEKWAEGNIISAFQNYPEDHYRIIYIDDCSTDKTLAIINQTIEKYHKQHLITIIPNQTRNGALRNHWTTINTMIKDNEIVVILDGDDQLANNGVLNFLNDIYTKNDVWFTYGQYRDIYSKNIGFNIAMPTEVVKKNEFRKWGRIPSHLRTFYAKLYKLIKIEDLMLDGDFFEMNADMATALPMIEMARDHFMFISKVLYFYNDKNPISDHRKNEPMQKSLDKYVRSLTAYKPLEKLF
ncbi:MAG: glycosyltransferase family 2 protein [Candidatus Babeliaceae bacterium]|nr:glycosyltransferase family 2 protein [Candidatus Babeliaceae bacterium]